MDAVLCFLAVLCLCAFFTWVRAGSAIAPLLVLAAAMVFFSLCGMAGVLVAGGWVFYAAALCLGALALYKGRAALVKSMLTPGFMLFCVLGLVALVYFGLRQPVFSHYDEFSFWGTAAKLVKQNAALYTTADMGWTWVSTQSPGLIMLSWFCQFFGAGFAAWKVYWIYALLLFACVAALVSALDFARWRTALPLAVAGLLLPFFFSEGNATVHLSSAYLSAYADIPGGMLFGGVLAVYFSKRAAGAGGLWCAALPLAALALTKDSMVAVALVAAGVMAADCLLFGTGWPVRQGQSSLTEKRPLWKEALVRAGAFAGWFAAVLLPAWLWQSHVGGVVAQRVQQGYTGSTNSVTPMLAMQQCIGALLGTAPRPDALDRVMADMGDAFLGYGHEGGQRVAGLVKSSMVGSGLASVLLVLALFLAAALLAGGVRQGLRFGLAGGLLLGGFTCYNLMLLAFYAFLFSNKAVVDYGRYMSTYYVGWMMAGLVLLGLAAAGRPAPEAATGKKVRLAGAAVLVVGCLMALRFAQLVRPGYSVLDYPADAYDGQRRQQQVADSYKAAMQPGSRVFFVHQGGNGQQWHEYAYYMLPWVLDYSITGGGGFPPLYSDWQGLSPEALQAKLLVYLEESGCRYIFVDVMDETFAEAVGPLFADGLAAGGQGPAMYELGPNGLFVPVRPAGESA